MPSRPSRVIRSSELRARRGKPRASQRGELDDLAARLVKTETQAFRNLRGDAAALEDLAAVETTLTDWADSIAVTPGVEVQINELVSIPFDDLQVGGQFAAQNNATVIGNLILGGGASGIVGASWSLADDAATSFILPTSSEFVGMLLYGAGVNSGAANPWGVWFVRGSGTPAVRPELIGSGVSLVDTTTGALAGTTGVDTHFTISAHTDGKAYLENRAGSARSGRVVFFGG